MHTLQDTNLILRVLSLYISLQLIKFLPREILSPFFFFCVSDVIVFRKESKFRAFPAPVCFLSIKY